MARRTPTDIENLDMKWHVIRLLIPYLLEFKKRTLLAFICLGLAKLSSISLPFFMKYIVDNLDTQMSPAAGSNTAAVVAIPIMLIIA